MATSRTAGDKRTRAPYANGQRTRAALVASAFDVFAERGFQRLSLRQIADEIGTSHTALLHHFGSKDALLQAVLDEREAREGPARGELIAERGLLDAVPEIMRQNARQRGVIQLDSVLQVEALRADHIAHDFVSQRRTDFFTSVRDELEREQAAGRLRDDLDLVVVARLITSLVEGLQLAWLSDRDVDMADHIAAFLDLLRAPHPDAP
jgi:AcrR family transcriptional regulator